MTFCIISFAAERINTNKPFRYWETTGPPSLLERFLYECEGNHTCLVKSVKNSMKNVVLQEEETAEGRQKSELKADVSNHLSLDEMHFSFHFLSHSVPITLTSSLFQPSEFEIDR